MKKPISIRGLRARFLLDFLNSYDPASSEAAVLATLAVRYRQSMQLSLSSEMKDLESFYQDRSDDDKKAFSTEIFASEDRTTLTLDHLEERRKRTASLKLALETAVGQDELHERKTNILLQNVSSLAAALKLDEDELKLLQFFVDYDVLKTFLSKTRFDGLGEDDYYEHIGRFLSVTEGRARALLAPGGRLRKTGLIYKTPVYSYTSTQLTENDTFLIDKSFMTQLRESSTTDAGEVLARRLVGTLVEIEDGIELEDYVHMEKELNNFLETLRGALDDPSAKGRVVLIYGPPGTGKSRLVGLIRKILNVEAYRTGQDKDKELQDGVKLDDLTRLRELQRADVCAESLGMKRVIIFGDEIEDWARSNNLKENPGKNSKGPLLATLEEAINTIVLITNRIDVLDPAFVRRCIKLKVSRQPLSARKDLFIKKFKKMCGLTLNEEVAWELARSAADFSPADINSVMRDASWREDIRGNLAAVVEAVKINIAQTAIGQIGGGALVPSVSDISLATVIDPLLSVMTPPREQAMSGLVKIGKRSPEANGTILLLGPEGSGKKTFANELARNIGKRLDVRTYNDFLNPMSGAFVATGLAAFLEEAKIEGTVPMITNCSDLLTRKLPSEDPVYMLLKQFPGQLIIASNTNAPAAEHKNADVQLQQPAQDASEEQAITSAREMMKGMMQEMISTLGQLGLGGVSSTSHSALREFTQVIKFDTFGKENIQAAFQNFFGVSAPQEVLQLTGLVPYDFVMLAHKLGAADRGQSQFDARSVYEQLCHSKGIEPIEAIKPQETETVATRPQDNVTSAGAQIIPISKFKKTPPGRTL